MSRTTGHVFHRYQGHKALLAERAARKALLLADDGAEPSDVPFWMEAEEPSPYDCEVEDSDLYDHWERMELAREEDRCWAAYRHWDIFDVVLDHARDVLRDDFDLAWEQAQEAEAQKAAWLAGTLAA